MRDGPDGGFTLLELLVVGVIVAMIAAIGASGLRFGARAWDRVEDVAESEIEARAVRRFLTELIEGARPVRMRDGTREPPALFFGAPDRLILTAPLPARLAAPGPMLVGLGFEGREDGMALTLRWRALGSGRPRLDFDDADARDDLATGLSSGRFSYRARGDAALRESIQGGPGWPPMVEIELDWGDDGPRWPPLPVAPRAVGVGEWG